MKPHSKIDIGIIFGYENVYMKQHLRSQDESKSPELLIECKATRSGVYGPIGEQEPQHDHFHRYKCDTSPPAIFLIEIDSAKSVDGKAVIRERRDDGRYASSIHPKDSAQQENDQCLLKPRHMTSLDHVCEDERKLDLGRQNHEHDENSCLMNATNTGYNEAGVDDLNITDHKGLRQR